MITRDDIKVGNKLKLLRDRGMNRVNDDVKKGEIIVIKKVLENSKTKYSFTDTNGFDFFGCPDSSLEDFDLAPSDLPTDRPLTYDETQMLQAGDVIDCWYARNLIIKTISNSSIAFENETRKWGLSAKVKNTCGSIFFVSHGGKEVKEEKKEEVKDFGLSEMAKGFIKTQAEQRVVDKMAGCNGLEKLDYESMEAHINAHKEFLKRSTTKSVSQILYGR